MNTYYEDLYGENLMTYRLSDGSHVIAEELEIDEDAGIIHIVDPLELFNTNIDVRLRRWMVADDDSIELNTSQIIARSSTSPLLIKYYLKYIAYDRLINNIRNIEEDTMHQDDNDDFDNLDSAESFLNKLKKDSESRWDWKHN